MTYLFFSITRSDLLILWDIFFNLSYLFFSSFSSINLILCFFYYSLFFFSSRIYASPKLIRKYTSAFILFDLSLIFIRLGLIFILFSLLMDYSERLARFAGLLETFSLLIKIIIIIDQKFLYLHFKYYPFAQLLSNHQSLVVASMRWFLCQNKLIINWI